MFSSVRKVRNSNLINLSKRYLGIGIEESDFKIADHHIDIHKKLPELYQRDFFIRLREINLNLKQGNELSELEKNFLRYYIFSSYSNLNFLNLNSKFRVLTTSAINLEIQPLISDYEKGWDNSKYVAEVRSFLGEEQAERDKLLPYMEDFTILPDEHLGEVDEFINSHLSTMAKVILSIRERGGNFVLKEAECIFRWEAWRHMAWILRDVRENPGKWTVVEEWNPLDSVRLIISRNFLKQFLKYQIYVTKLGFEDNVYLLTNSSSFIGKDVKLVDSTDDEELNEFNHIKFEIKSLFEAGWEEAKILPTLETTFTESRLDSDQQEKQLEPSQEVYWDVKKDTLIKNRLRLINEQTELDEDIRKHNNDKLELDDNKKSLVKEQAKFEQDQAQLHKKQVQLKEEQVQLGKDEKDLSKLRGDLDSEQAQLKRDKLKLTKKVEQHKKDSEQFKQDQVKLEKEMKDASEKLRQEMEEDLEKLRWEKAREVEKIHNSFNDTKKNVERLTKTLLDKVETLEGKKIKLSDEVEILDKKKVKLKNLNSQIKKLDSQVERVNNQLKELDSQVESSKEELTQLQAKKKDLLKYIKGQRTQRKNLEKELEELSSSLKKK